jgi:cell division protein FtsI/penicillin-binding protein 2/cell division protein FtsW (lipid II flippase)
VLIVESGGSPGTPHEPPPKEKLRHKDSGGVAFDVLAILAAIVLVGLGLANLEAVEGPATAARQAAVGAVGIVLVGVLWRFRVGLLVVLGWVTYLLAVLLLGVVLVMGVSANGATRWIGIGGFTFQPSELAKLGLLLVLAAVLGSDRAPLQRFVFAIGLALVPIGLTLLQPDLSTTTLLAVLTVAMLIIGRVPARFLLPMFAAAAVATPLVIGMLRPYQVERLGSFLVGAHVSPTGAGWAVQQARIALGSGSLFGRSGEPLTDLLAQYLPERESDLALASVVEQFGLVAGGLVVVAAIVLVWRIALASRAPRTPHGALVGGGLAVLLGVEIVVSLGGNLGLLPLAGVPFPLLSIGGTALLVHLVALGVVLGVRRDGARRRLWAVPRWRARPRLVRATAVALTGLLVAFGLYGWNVQAAEGAALTAAGQVQMTRCIRIPAQRGMITDRHGAPLATGTAGSASEIDQVVAVPALLRSRPDDVARLAALTAQPVDAVRAALDGVPATTLAVRMADVPRATGNAVAAAGINGVLVVPEPRRSYPAGPLLGPVLGFAGVATPADLERWSDLPPGEIVGRAGLEQQYDAVLRGTNGQQCVYVTPAGVPVAMGARTEPVPGANLRLSLDLGLQQQLTSSLATALRGQRSPSAIGAAVAMDPRDGQVLAIASLPSYDNSVYGPPIDPAGLQAAAAAPGHPMIEHVTQAAVPPGSTFKLVVGAADVAHPVFRPEQVIPTGASFTLGDHTFGNWQPMGPMDLVQSLAWSNDVYFYKLANALGPDSIIDAAHALGVGSPTGIDLPAESAGYLGTPRSVHEGGGVWYGGSTVILGIGQGYLQVTPLQNARWTAGVATGRLVTPRLGLATGTGGGAFTSLPATPTTPIPFAGALGPVRDGMRAAVTGGTATRLAGLPVPVGAKTGTAEDGSLSADSYDNWMTAAAPMPDPGVVMTALVQGPGKGANNAGVVVADGLRYYLDHQADVLATPPVQSP